MSQVSGERLGCPVTSCHSAYIFRERLLLSDVLRPLPTTPAYVGNAMIEPFSSPTNDRLRVIHRDPGLRDLGERLSNEGR